jgi:glycosyltransferase involved in cell wall biosynthesis
MKNGSHFEGYKMSSASTTNSEPKLRVLQAGPIGYPPAGVANAIKTLCMSLRRLGHEVTLVSDGEDLDELKANGIACHVTDLRQGPKTLVESSWRLRKILRSFRPEVVHVHGRSTALHCVLAGRTADWFTLHNTHLTHQVGFYDVGLIRKYLSPWGKNFFVLDRLGGEYLQREFGVRPESIVQIGNGIDCQRFRAPTFDERVDARNRFGVAHNETFVVFVGRLHPSKQPLAVVEAAARAAKTKRTNLKFALIGDGELRDAVRAAISEQGMGDICSLYPWMDPLRAYFAADLVVMPSLFEGYGLVGAEAIASGCPVLRSRTGGSEQMIREGVSGFECEIEAEKFVERLFQIIQEPEKLAVMRASAREFALAELDVTNTTRAITRAYRERIKGLARESNSGSSEALLSTTSIRLGIDTNTDTHRGRKF